MSKHHSGYSGADPRPLRVFLCHSSDDRPQVRELYQWLRAEGIDAWLDEENLDPGEDWALAIPRAVRNSDVVLVCLSKSSVNRAGYVQKEIRLALDAADEQPEGAIFLIPVKLEECAVPERLSRWHWVDLPKQHAREKLLRALSRRANELGATVSPFTFTNDSARFLDELQVRRVVLATLQQGDLIEGSLLIYETRRQRTWLVASRNVLCCILDDNNTRRAQTLVQWTILKTKALPVIARPDDGVVDIGPHRNWLYSLHLFPSAARLEQSIGDLIRASGP